MTFFAFLFGVLFGYAIHFAPVLQSYLEKRLDYEED